MSSRRNEERIGPLKKALSNSRILESFARDRAGCGETNTSLFIDIRNILEFAEHLMWDGQMKN